MPSADLGPDLDAFVEKIRWDIVNRENGWYSGDKMWLPIFTGILRNIKVPRRKDAPDEDRLGKDVWLPPRLPIADDLRTLEYGVLLCGVGKISYAKKQIVTMIQYLKENLDIPDAEERARMRAKGDMSRGALQGFAFVGSENFVKGPLKPFLSFFDAVYTTDDLAKYPFDWQKVIEKNNRMTKIVKVHAISASPFDRTLFIDFDSFPCRPDFGKQLLEVAGDADFALTNAETSIASLPEGDNRSFLAEHNSCVVYFNMQSERFRLLSALYVQAYHAYSGVLEGATKIVNQHDQGPLMIAMQAMIESFQCKPGDEPSIPNKDVRDVIEANNLGYIQHNHFAWDDVCRIKTAGGRKAECGRKFTCAVAHKDFKGDTKLSDLDDETRNRERSNNDKVFAIGFGSTGNIDAVFEHARKKGGGAMISKKKKEKATKEILKGAGSYETQRSTNYPPFQFFSGQPYNMRELGFYRETAIVYSTSRYILTIRDPDKWYNNVEKTPRNQKIFGARSTSKKDFIAAMKSHNLAVRSFFHDVLKQPERLLEIDMSDKKYDGGAGWMILCDFLRIKRHNCPNKMDLPKGN
jgi:hypothetical protein